MKWNERGPNNVGGRTKGMMFDPNDSTSETIIAFPLETSLISLITSMNNLQGRLGEMPWYSRATWRRF